MLTSTSYASCKREKAKAQSGGQTCSNRRDRYNCTRFPACNPLYLTASNPEEEEELPPRAELSLVPPFALWDSHCFEDNWPELPGGPEKEGSCLIQHSQQKPTWVVQHCLLSPSSLVSKQTHAPPTFSQDHHNTHPLTLLSALFPSTHFLYF